MAVATISTKVPLAAEATRSHMSMATATHHPEKHPSHRSWPSAHPRSVLPSLVALAVVRNPEGSSTAAKGQRQLNQAAGNYAGTRELRHMPGRVVVRQGL